jgi:20S proteasome subunit beta 2
MGSGSLAAMSVFETQWKTDLSRDDAVTLCANAIKAGIWNDLGSGSNVDVAVITEDKTTLMRNFKTPNTRQPKQRNYRFQKGTTAVLNEKIITKEQISKYVTVSELQDDSVTATAETMDLDT